MAAAATGLYWQSNNIKQH
jgi:uracil phosphoribosyltransferase